jgi:hypothetical protein
MLLFCLLVAWMSLHVAFPFTFKCKELKSWALVNVFILVKWFLITNGHSSLPPRG